MPKNELEHHERTCAKKFFVPVENVEVTFKAPDVNANSHLAVCEDSEWKEVETAYDPGLVVANKKSIRLAQCVPKSERIEFRFQERQRNSTLDMNTTVEVKEFKVEAIRKPTLNDEESELSKKLPPKSPVNVRKIVNESAYDRYVREELMKQTL